MLAKQWASNKFSSFFPETLRPKDNYQEAHYTQPSYPHAMFASPSQSTPLAVPEEMYGVRKTEVANILKLCSLKPGDHELLPEWFKVAAEKGKNDNTQNQATVTALNNTIYEDAEISITSQLLTMIHKCKWFTNQPVTTYSMACKGLVPEISKETINKMNKQAEALEIAKNTTAKEIHEGLFQKAMVHNEDSKFF
eukprot:14569069-Ditylum_brightwellii.AAC.2